MTLANRSAAGCLDFFMDGLLLSYPFSFHYPFLSDRQDCVVRRLKCRFERLALEHSSAVDCSPFTQWLDNSADGITDRIHIWSKLNVKQGRRLLPDQLGVGRATASQLRTVLVGKRLVVKVSVGTSRPCAGVFSRRKHGAEVLQKQNWALLALCAALAATHRAPSRIWSTQSIQLVFPM